ncbi:MAG: hypothetical protein E5X25_00355, partial [Mesorhizobium sp.]
MCRRGFSGQASAQAKGCGPTRTLPESLWPNRDQRLYLLRNPADDRRRSLGAVSD